MRPNRFCLLLGMLATAGLLACEAEEASELEPGTEVAPATEPVPPGTSAAAASLDVAATPEYGPHLTDATGRALYLLEADPPSESTCYDACAQVWPPVLAPERTPSPGDASVQAAMIGTLTRRDGAMQVTYNEHPLYYYSRDPAPGQITGHDHTDEWGEWYLVTPEGQELEDN